jgi:integrase
LRALRAKAKGPWVFPARADAKRAAHLHPESLSRAFARLCDRLRRDEEGRVVEGIGLADVSTHDLRRTAITGLEELGHGSVVRRIAGHEARDVTSRHYDRSRRVDAMRAALEAWSAEIDAAAQRATADLGRRRDQ